MNTDYLKDCYRHLMEECVMLPFVLYSELFFRIFVCIRHRSYVVGTPASCSRGSSFDYEGSYTE